jgi:hypothetical protein
MMESCQKGRKLTQIVESYHKEKTGVTDGGNSHKWKKAVTNDGNNLTAVTDRRKLSQRVEAVVNRRKLPLKDISCQGIIE